MGKYFWFLLLVLLGLAVFLGQAGDFVLTLLYLLLGAYLVGRVWSGRSLSQLKTAREFVSHAFLGEQIPVNVDLSNQGRLPIAWLQVRESLPVELAPPNSLHQVISLGGKSKARFSYLLDCRRRGYYSLGPMTFNTGDVLGMADRSGFFQADHITVFPKIIPLARFGIKSHAPIGTLRHTQPIFEDPSRVVGKRDYTSGDSLRRIDWKSSASSGKLQVKVYEPSIALETALFLNLNIGEYHWRTSHDDTELAIILAASLANHITALRQSVGLFTNGIDPLGLDSEQPFLPPRHGRGHLLRLLELLARLQAGETYPLVQLIQSRHVHMTWGTTAALITNHVDDALFDNIFQMMRRGIDCTLLICGPVAGFPAIQQKAGYFGIPMYQFMNERDLDIWRT